MKNVGMVTTMELVKYSVAAGAVALLWLVSLMVVWARGYEAGVMDDPRKVSAPEWISAAERLPDPGQIVLAFALGGYAVAGYTGGLGWSLADDLGWKPTHWMPLPKGPGQEG